MGLIDDIRRGMFRAGDEAALVAPGHQPTLAEIAIRIRDGADLLPAVREFLDVAQRCSDGTLVSLVAERPSRVDARTDALLAAVAEHLLAVRGLPPARWPGEPERFLERFWFVSDVPGFRATAIAQSPVAFKRRGIMWPARSLVRV